MQDGAPASSQRSQAFNVASPASRFRCRTSAGHASAVSSEYPRAHEGICRPVLRQRRAFSPEVRISTPSTVRRRVRAHRLPSFAAIARAAGVLAPGLTATTCKRTRLSLAWASSHPRQRRPRSRSGRPAGASALRPWLLQSAIAEVACRDPSTSRSPQLSAPEIRQCRDARRRRPSAADADELGVALCHELRCHTGLDTAVTKVLPDRPTCDAQQALPRCRSHSPSGHQPTPANLFRDAAATARSRLALPSAVLMRAAAVSSDLPTAKVVITSQDEADSGREAARRPGPAPRNPIPCQSRRAPSSRASIAADDKDVLMSPRARIRLEVGAGIRCESERRGS